MLYPKKILNEGELNLIVIKLLQNKINFLKVGSVKY